MRILKLKHLVWLLVAALVAVGWLVFVGREAAPATERGKPKRSRLVIPTPFDLDSRTSSLAKKALEKPSSSPLTKTHRVNIKLTYPSDYSAADVRISDAIRKALENDDLAATLTAAQKALDSSNPEVRMAAVDALAWFGSDALPELTVFMADADAEVAKSAMAHWELGVSQVDSAKEKTETTMLALATLKDMDVLEDVGMHFCGAANELIDGEEDESVAAEYRQQVVEWLVTLIEGEDEAQSVAAMEMYEGISSSPWLGVEEAEKYLADPDNYVAPDVDETTVPEADAEIGEAESQSEKGQDEEGALE